MQGALFAGTAAEALPGFHYHPEFLSAAEEGELLERIGALPWQQAQYPEWHARRRIVSFGGRYDFTLQALSDAPPIPAFLLPLRERVAALAGLSPARIHHAMLAEYAPGTPLGWHRDVPEFEVIMGVSLPGRARLRFRAWPPRPEARTALALGLAPRSAYVLRDEARWQWQHAVSPTRELRYSITFRTRSS
ncbi:MAG: alpha-ketoglutarate-dependent dioxygenase AlkB [Proteobacteria bacterium]|nr:alpha-ketoglutarate-dependent dioxygenase AlkB [Pseudomonadota bacterium]